jgi:hydroxyacylglutathione hydrolase
VWGEAVRQLLRAGYDRLAGYLEGGVRAWAARGLPVRALPQLSPREAWEGLQRGERSLLDVRQPAEWRRGHPPDATFVPGATLPARVTALRGRPWAVICATGYRSTVAASVLLRAGMPDALPDSAPAGAPVVANVLGGMAAWKAAGLPETSEVEAQGAPRRRATRPAA